MYLFCKSRNCSRIFFESNYFCRREKLRAFYCFVNFVSIKAIKYNLTMQLAEISSISIELSFDTIIGRLVTSREFTEIISKTAESWNNTGPPADIEYAEEPMGVDTIIPSLLSCQTSSPLTRKYVPSALHSLKRKLPHHLVLG